ncbi:uncharacterized protein LOC122296860 [Carya illinoinensis]|uniref:uncharacterized protein LOC122296860 n=1 Tax=Carya illinoinensis TaxID=32201 RepID=UPI001C728C74|nr:uncharacterized protein LOC122296860 [Carya illinoinensis]
MALHRQRHSAEGASSSCRPNSQPRMFIQRNPLEGHERLWNDYFAQPPIYPPNVFRRRFRMNRVLFLCIHSAVETHGDYFVQKRDANGRLGLSSLQKMTAAIRMLAYENCPNAWKGIYSGHVNEPTIILKAVASYDLWIWHAFFGLPESHNDINVLDRFSVFAALAKGRAPPCSYTINGHKYTMGYYLADGIYPSWVTLVKTIPTPHRKKKQHFATYHESARKDVEHAFGVLQARFTIVRRPARYFQPEFLKDIMYACIILHNMIVEGERHLYFGADQFNYEANDDTPSEPISRDNIPEFIEFTAQHHRIRDKGTHSQLQADLIEHLWNMHGQA